MPTRRKIVGVLKSNSTLVTTITQRCLSDQPSIQRYERSIARQMRPPLLEWPSSSLRNREQSIGVIVNEMHMLISTAKPTTKPKLLKNRPTRPDMNATGMKITSSDSVVATTAKPISRVAEL